jgi:hypothetical protein
MTAYIRIDAVNIYNTIEDTEDLSTRRGSALMLLEAISALPTKFTSLAPISTGASAGFFAVKDGQNADALCQDIRTHLHIDQLYKNGTFMVTQVTANETSFAQQSEQAIANNRWAQMQSLSFSAEVLTAGHGVCQLSQKQATPTASATWGASVVARKDEGKGQRSLFYARWTERVEHYQDKFTDDFATLSGGWTGATGNLDHKIAVFYADGNDFGRRLAACKDAEKLATFDAAIKDARKSMLIALLDEAQKDTAWKTEEGKQIRLETLLWGGDELMLVVPAWKGLELAQFFFKHIEKMEWQGEALTHACGLVFAHHNAPISRITRLAQNLAEQGKLKTRTASTLTWTVLESFDHIGNDMAYFLERRYAVKETQPNWECLLLAPDALNALCTYLPPIKKHLPRSSITRIVRMLATVQGACNDPLVKRSYDNIYGALEDQQKNDFNQLWRALQAEPCDWTGEPSAKDLSAWVKLIELWDYVGAESSQKGDAA